MIRSIISFPAACLELMRVLMSVGGRRDSAYLAWRAETAFGSGEVTESSRSAEGHWNPPKAERKAAILRYALWARRMRGFARLSSRPPKAFSGVGHEQ